MAPVEQLSGSVGVAAACRALGVSRTFVYRYRQAQAAPSAAPQRHPRPPRALGETERQQVLDTLQQERFVGKPPALVYATLLHEGTCLCSERTMYRIAAFEADVRERRDQLRYAAHSKPELLATGPGQVWSWGITKLKGPAKWTSTTRT